jgi:hypothetical protein
MSLDKHLELRERAKKFAVRIVRMSRTLPDNREANIISNQIIDQLPAWLRIIGL